MRTHTYWKTYEEYLEWSFNQPKQINYVTKQHSINGVRASDPPSAKGTHMGDYSPAKGGLRGSIPHRIRIKFID